MEIKGKDWNDLKGRDWREKKNKERGIVQKIAWSDNNGAQEFTQATRGNQSFWLVNGHRQCTERFACTIFFYLSSEEK